jgi:precorrin-6B C5,15-methyltransferase / cobalt-precorrin-6B C5,C15-methyltransferase
MRSNRGAAAGPVGRKRHQRDTVPTMHTREPPDPAVGPVTVVGIGADGWAGLTDTARDALRAAAVITGSSRQLALLPDLKARRMPLPAPLLARLNDLVRDNPGLCVLASGDPTLHGIGATLARRLGPAGVRILPAVSSVALACARLGWPQQDVTVMSLVNQAPEVALAAMQPGARLLLLCRDGQTPAQVARVLTDGGWGASDMTVLEQLGGPTERVTGPQEGSGFAESGAAAGKPGAGKAGFDDLCVLAVVAQAGPGARALTRTPGLPDDAYESDGQITRRELRALALAALRPGPGQLLWDVGAGSGSVGIEWMRADPLARAIAIEAKAGRSARISRNAAALGVPGLEVVTGTAPASLDGLPAPDAIFIGGGLTAGGMIETCWQRLPPGGRLVAHAVTVESETILHRRRQADGGELVKIAVSYLEPLGGFTTWRPALPITQWQVTRP